nr:MAG: polyprotein [Totiviridae sp.]
MEFLQIIPQPAILEPFIVPYSGECVCGIVFRREFMKLKYARLDYVSRYTPTTMAACGANVAGNFRCGVTKENHHDYYYNDRYMQAEWNEVPGYEWYMGKIRDLPISRVTAEHHLFINDREIGAVIKKLKQSRDQLSYQKLMAMAQVLSQLENHGIDNKVSAITHLTYISVAPRFAIDHLMYIWSVSENEKQYMNLLKKESQAAKQLQTVFRDDLSAIFELQVLRNRVYENVDWDEEIDHRVNVNSMPISSLDVRTASVRIFRQARNEGAKARMTSWSDYWKGRWSSMPGGSVVSQYAADKNLKSMLPREAKIKAAWFSANKNKDYEYWYRRQPSIYASTSTKYEWGKVRALYGCDVTSFLHSDFAMGDCENLLPSYFPVGRRANDKYIKRTIDSFKLGVPFCFDYDDFNSQHSTSSMKAVLMAWLDVFGSDINEQQVASMKWTIESLDQVIVSFNEVRKEIKVNGTLMSGWRLTSFINSVLNRVYLEKAGLRENVIYALHNGDDMFATTQNMQQAMNVVKNAKNIGIRAQVSKTNIGTIGEFLRVDTRAKNPHGAQYLARSVATAVHGRVETGAPNDLIALHVANKERTSAMKERGGDRKVIDVIERELVKFECKLFDVQDNVLQTYDTTHPVQGGGDDSVGVREYRIERIRQRTSEKFRQSVSLIDPGVDDYVELVVTKFKIPLDKVSRTQVRDKAYDSLSRNKISYETVIETDDRMHIYRGLYKAYAKSTYIAPISKLRSVGMANAKYMNAVKGAVVNMISNAKDPVRLMSCVF